MATEGDDTAYGIDDVNRWRIETMLMDLLNGQRALVEADALEVENRELRRELARTRMECDRLRRIVAEHTNQTDGQLADRLNRKG